MWKYKKIFFIRTTSSCGLNSQLQFKGVSLYFSYLFKFKDGNKKEMMISSHSSCSKRKNQSFKIFGSIDQRLLSKIVNTKKSGLTYKTLFNHPFSSMEFAIATMHGWNISIGKTKDIYEWSHYWCDGRRSHMGHAHDCDDHGRHEKLGAYGEKILRWGLCSDITLTVGKVAAGYISGSTAIIADAAHSASDIVCNFHFE